MIQVQNLTLRFGDRVLFEDVNLKFTAGNCYGVIGANGAGKSTFVKILSGEVDYHTGDIILPQDQRLAVLKQNIYEFNEQTVLGTVIMGHKPLFDLIQERDTLYAKEDFSEEDGVRSSEIEEEFGDMGGWEAEAQAGELLSGLGIKEGLHDKLMKDITDDEKVRVLLAQALFGDPDVLLLDEPTNGLDINSVMWLEEFLAGFKNTVIVVSHDRHFLNRVCTHTLDIDFKKIRMYTGNYDFWYLASQLAQKQLKDENKKKEDKAKELKEFIAKFSSNAARSKQATARKKLLDKITLEDMPVSTRKYPFINFKPEREAGNDILNIEGLSKSEDGEVLFKDMNLVVNKGDRIAVISDNESAKVALFKVLSGEMEPDGGSFKWGITITQAYFPRDHEEFFAKDINLIDWLRQYSEEKEEGFIRGYLGRMLFSGQEATKKCNVLSGGEKVRCMLSRMMLSGSNFLILDEPTNHLDLESITSLNTGMQEFTGTLMFTSADHELTQTVADRILEIAPDGTVRDYMTTYDEYLERQAAAVS